MATNKFLSRSLMQDFLLSNGPSTERQVAKYFEVTPNGINKRMDQAIGIGYIAKKRLKNKRGKLAWHYQLTKKAYDYLKENNLEKFSSMNNPQFVKSIERMNKINEALSAKYVNYIPKIIVNVD